MPIYIFLLLLPIHPLLLSFYPSISLSILSSWLSISYCLLLSTYTIPSLPSLLLPIYIFLSVILSLYIYIYIYLTVSSSYQLIYLLPYIYLYYPSLQAFLLSSCPSLLSSLIFPLSFYLLPYTYLTISLLNLLSIHPLLLSSYPSVILSLYYSIPLHHSTYIFLISS